MGSATNSTNPVMAVMNAVRAISGGAMGLKQALVDAVMTAPQPALLFGQSGVVLAVNEHAVQQNIATSSAIHIGDVLIDGEALWRSLAESDERMLHTLPTTTAVLCALRVRRCVADDAAEGAYVVLLVESFGVEVAALQQTATAAGNYVREPSLSAPASLAATPSSSGRRVKVRKSRSSKQRRPSDSDSTSESSHGVSELSEDLASSESNELTVGRSHSQQDIISGNSKPAIQRSSPSLPSFASVLPTGWFARLRRGAPMGASNEMSTTSKVALVGDVVEVRRTLSPTVACVSVGGFECALKTVVLPSDAASSVAVNERCAMIPKVAALSHEGVARIVGYHLLADATQLLVFSELCDYSLHDYLAQHEAPLADALLLDFAVQLAVAIRHIHFHLIMHRDINPTHVLVKNVVRDFAMISSNWEAKPVLKLASFASSASFTGAPGQQYRAGVGTPKFMAPEVATGVYDESCDIWSFGAVLCVLLAHGHQPRQSLDGGPSLQLPANCNTLLAELFSKCTSMRPAERPTATQLCSRVGANHT
jgi:hypothetical protein